MVKEQYAKKKKKKKRDQKYCSTRIACFSCNWLQYRVTNISRELVYWHDGRKQHFQHLTNDPRQGSLLAAIQLPFGSIVKIRWTEFYKQPHFIRLYCFPVVFTVPILCYKITRFVKNTVAHDLHFIRVNSIGNI